MSGPPPDLLRTSATPEERALVCAQLGVVVPAEDVPALLDPRGVRFQRLEWLGDSLLDVLVARWRAGLAEPPDLADVVSDEALGRRATASGLPALLDWQPTAHRLADLLEAAVAAGHRGSGFVGARTVAIRLVEPRLAEVRLPRELSPRRAAEAGASVLEAAAALLLFVRRPEADEGALSEERAALLGREHGTALQAELGRVLVVRGEQAAVQAALPALR